MEVHYKTDLYASYMQIEIPEQIDRNQYSFKMVEKNRMKGILACKERVEDGKAYFYVDITGKKNLVQEYADKEMELEDIITLFQQIIPVFEELRNYLLTEKMILLEPEFLYRDMEDESLYVTLLPWEREEGTSLHKLAEFFLEKISQRDEHGVNAAYHFYRQQSQPQFSLHQFLPILEKESILKRQKQKDKIPNKNIQSFSYEIEGTEKEEIKKSKWDNPQSLYKESVYEKEREETRSLGEENKKNKKGTGWIFSIFVGAVLLIMGMLPILPSSQKMICLAAALTFSLIGVTGGIYQSFKYRNKDNRKTDSSKAEKRDLEKESQEPVEYTPAAFEETVFFQPGEDESLLKLQWKEKGRENSYMLQQLPVTVGKLKEEASIVIKDSSVSRIHCRFVEKDGGVAIMDMNSTNGTSLNGMKLKPGEILEIVKNDEILIGKVRVVVV